MGDALYLQTSLVKEVERLGLVWAFTLKENQPELLREAECFTQQSPTGVHAAGPGDSILALCLRSIGPWLIARCESSRTPASRRGQRQNAQRTKVKAALTQASTNFYATKFELGSISPVFIHQFSRSRWRIDTEVFQTLTTDCHLKHPAVHQTTTLVVLTLIRFFACTLSLIFYHRQVRSRARAQCEIFHQCATQGIAYGFAAFSPNTS